MLTIAESFKRFREHFQLSKTDVAKTLGIKLPSYVYETESKNVYPNGATLIKLATAYNVSTDYLLGLSDNPDPNYSSVTGNKTVRALTGTDKEIINVLVASQKNLNETQQNLKMALSKFGINSD